MYRNRFITQARSLRNKASQTRQVAQVGKASGLTSVALGVLGLTGTAAALAPIGIGAAIYGACAICEASRTRKFMPIPWLDWDALDAAGQRAGLSDGQGALGVQPHHYLSDEDKARFYLSNFQGHSLTELADSVPPVEFNHLVTNMVDMLVGTSRDYLNYPELMAEAQGVDLLSVASQSIPNTPAPKVKNKATPRKMAPAKPQTVPAVVAPIVDDPWEKPVKAVSSNRATAQELITARPYVSRAFYGAQRSGKTYLAAVCSADLAASTLGAKTYYINLCHASVDPLDIWGHSKQVVEDLATCDAYAAEDAIKKALELLEEAMSSPHSIIVLDEYVYTASITNTYSEQLKPVVTKVADIISTLSSAGTKRKQAIWTIAPSIVASRLSNEGKSVKSLEPLLVGIAPGYTIDVDGHGVIWSDELFTQVYDNYKGVQHPGDKDYLSERIAWVNNKWRPVA